MTKIEIIEKMKTVFKEAEVFLNAIPGDQFSQRPSPERWSVGENIQHLFLSSKPLVGLFGKPDVMLKNWGESNRTSRSYTEIVDIYLEKLKGRVSTPSFIPENMDVSRTEVMQNFHAINVKFLERANDLTESDLDNYHIPHPIIGLLTCREFLYFTWYHTLHHLKTIENKIINN